MRLQNLINDDDAVSPVIGVILMVAITVILAAVIASFVLGLGQQTGNVSPQASFSISYDEPARNVTVTHDNGDPVIGTELYLRGSGFNNSDSTWDDFTNNPDTDGISGDSQYWEATMSGSSEGSSAVVAGDELTTRAAPNYELSVVWQSSEGDDSNTFVSDKGPEA